MLGSYDVPVQDLSKRARLVSNGKHSFFYSMKDFRILGPDDTVLVSELHHVQRINSGLVEHFELDHVSVIGDEHSHFLLISNQVNTRIILFSDVHPNGGHSIMEGGVTNPIVGLTNIANGTDGYIHEQAMRLIAANFVGRPVVKAIYKAGGEIQKPSVLPSVLDLCGPRMWINRVTGMPMSAVSAAVQGKLSAKFGRRYLVAPCVETHLKGEVISYTSFELDNGVLVVLSTKEKCNYIFLGNGKCQYSLVRARFNKPAIGEDAARKVIFHSDGISAYPAVQVVRTMCKKLSTAKLLYAVSKL